MKKLLTVCFLAIAAVVPTYAHLCMDGWYGAVSGQVSFHNDTRTGDSNDATIDHKTGYGVNASIGYILECWRLELEGSYRHYDNDCYTTGGTRFADSGDLSEFGLMVNGFYDYNLNDCFSMYAGAGLGAACTRLSIDNTQVCLKDDDINFAWQLMAGAAYHFNDCWALTVGYRFFSTAKPCLKTLASETAKEVRKTPHSNNIDLGLRVRF